MLDRIRKRVHAELDDWAPDFHSLLAAREGDQAAVAILADTRARLDGMLASIPDPGWIAPHMRAFTTAGAIQVALHLALRARGYDAARTWEVCEGATRTHFARMSKTQKWLASDGLFSGPMKALERRLAKRSRKAPVGGWVYDFVEASEGVDGFGIDYHRCAIHELARANDAADFAPYICLGDIPGSEIFGWGLVRTETLAQGGARCDFRFRRGGPTDVKVKLPIAT